MSAPRNMYTTPFWTTTDYYRKHRLYGWTPWSRWSQELPASSTVWNIYNP